MRDERYHCAHSSPMPASAMCKADRRPNRPPLFGAPTPLCKFHHWTDVGASLLTARMAVVIFSAALPRYQPMAGQFVNPFYTCRFIGD